MVGYFNQNGDPVITVKIYGYSKENSQEVEAIVDTGFSGFVSLPLIYALKVGLILYSTASFTLADGSRDPVTLFRNSSIR